MSGEIAIIAKIAKIAEIETREFPHDFQLSILAVLAILAIARSFQEYQKIHRWRDERLPINEVNGDSTFDSALAAFTFLKFGRLRPEFPEVKH